MNREQIELASIDDFVSTYATGKEDLEAYNRAQDLLNEGFSTRKIGPMVGRSRGTILAWKNDQKRRPYVVSGLEKALLSKLLPLYVANINFSAVNILAAKVFWTGSLSPSHYSQPQLEICGSLESLRDLQDYLQEKLDLKMETYQNGKDSFSLKGGTSALFSRLLCAMGVPLSNNEYQMPEYVRKLIQSQPMYNPVVQRALQDFVHVLFEERFNVRPGKSTYQLHLKCFKKEEEARGHGNEVTNLIRTALPELPISGDRVKVYATGKESYMPKICLRATDMDSLSTHYPALLNESSLR